MSMDDSEWLTCPYNRAHRVPVLRMQRHLVKCEARHPPLGVCPYDARHRMPHEQLEAHTATCSTRIALSVVPGPRAPAAFSPPPPPPPADPDDEVWD